MIWGGSDTQYLSWAWNDRKKASMKIYWNSYLLYEKLYGRLILPRLHKAVQVEWEQDKLLLGKWFRKLFSLFQMYHFQFEACQDKWESLLGSPPSLSYRRQTKLIHLHKSKLYFYSASVWFLRFGNIVRDRQLDNFDSWPSNGTPNCYGKYLLVDWKIFDLTVLDILVDFAWVTGSNSITSSTLSYD